MKATAVCVLACLLAVDAASLRGAAEAENQERALLGQTYCPAKPFLTSVKPVMKRVGDNGWRLQPIVSSGDDVGGYKLPRNPDGIGAWPRGKNTVRIAVNAEVGSSEDKSFPVQYPSGGSIDPTRTLTGARVSYYDVDKTTKAIKCAGIAYNTVYDAVGNLRASGKGFERFCSAVGHREKEYGIENNIMLLGEEATGGNDGIGGYAVAIDIDNEVLYTLPALGKAGWESMTLAGEKLNNKDKIVAVIGDDQGGAFLKVFIGQKGRDAILGANADFLKRNGLAYGKLFVWKADDPLVKDYNTFNGTGNMKKGSLVQIDTRCTVDTPGCDFQGYATNTLLQERGKALGAFQFQRVEDVSTNPKNGDQVAFAVTGSGSPVNPGPPGTVKSNVFSTTMMIDMKGLKNALKSKSVDDIKSFEAEMHIIHDANEAKDPITGLATSIRSADNLDWTEDGTIVVQEDRSVGPEQFRTREASIYLIKDGGKGATPTSPERILEMDRSIKQLNGGFLETGAVDTGSWESTGLIDCADVFDARGKLYLFAVQTHSLDDGGQLLFAMHD